jgi:hypothetical protein
MSSAKLIKNNCDTKYTCNICTDEIKDDKIIGLNCDPLKHIFCYDCIFDWYKQIQISKKKYTVNYQTHNMCPICRKNGGLLPICLDKKIKGIHNMKLVNPIKVCGCKLLTSTGYCKTVGNEKYGGYCGKHKKILKKKENTNTIDPNKCGAKLKTKDGYCCLVGNYIYGGFCGVHKNYQKTLNTENLNDIDIIFNDILSDPLSDPLNDPLSDSLSDPLSDPLSDLINDPLNNDFIIV